jgi:hypothetical protein
MTITDYVSALWSKINMTDTNEVHICGIKYVAEILNKLFKKVWRQDIILSELAA